MCKWPIRLGLLICLLVFTAAQPGHADTTLPPFTPPPEGVIPDEVTATKIGQALLAAHLPEAEMRKLSNWGAHL